MNKLEEKLRELKREFWEVFLTVKVHDPEWGYSIFVRCYNKNGHMIYEYINSGDTLEQALENIYKSIE